MSVMFPQGGGFAQPNLFAAVSNSNLAGVLNPNIFRFNNPAPVSMGINPGIPGLNGVNAANILPMLFAFGLNNLFAQLNNGNPGIFGALGANPNLGANPLLNMNQPVGQGPEQRREGATNVAGRGQNFVIRDNGGDDAYTIGGAFNRVQISGDDDANTFRIGGMRNNVSVSNIGSDERIILEGSQADWMEVPTQGNTKAVTYINRATGTTATLATDGRRSADFVKQRVSFSQQGALP